MKLGGGVLLMTSHPWACHHVATERAVLLSTGGTGGPSVGLPSQTPCLLFLP